jgi:hypothetical protein
MGRRLFGLHEKTVLCAIERRFAVMLVCRFSLDHSAAPLTTFNNNVLPVIAISVCNEE